MTLTVRRSLATFAALLVVAAVLGIGDGRAAAASTTSECPQNSCPNNVGGTFVWHDTDGTVSGRFSGSLVLFPRISQVSCTDAADADTSRPQTTPTPGGPPHPGLIVPFPFTAPGPGKPLAAYIDIADYHGPGTYTNGSLAHQTYAYPSGIRSGIGTAPADSPGAAWSVTLRPDGSGHLTYSGPAQNPGPVVPKPFAIQLSMSWTCDDTATPVGAAAAPITTTTTSAAAPVAQTTKGSGLLLWMVLVPVLAALLAILLLLAFRRRRRRAPPPCTCRVTFSVTGPTAISVRECARPKQWVIDGRTLSAILTADGIEERHFNAVPVIECTGGATAEITGVTWSVTQTQTSPLTVTFVAHVAVHCPDGTVTESEQTVESPVTLHARACCGPDITEVYLASINRSLDKLRVDHPLSSTYFMARWGFRMVCRPLPRGTFIPGGCPSSQTCADTVTIVGRCVDCYVSDNFLFGVMAGWLDVPVAEMEAMGWGAKLVKTADPTTLDVGVVPGHVISEQLWLAGHAFGQQAHQNARDGRPYHLDRATLKQSLRAAQDRDDCGPCPESVRELSHDFAYAGW